MSLTGRSERDEGLALLDALVDYLDILNREWASTADAERYHAAQLALDAARRARRLLLLGPERQDGHDGKKD